MDGRRAMKIVVTDGATLNPGDLSWQELEELGDCRVYGHSSPSENVTRCKDADIAVTNKVVFDRGTIAALPVLKMISVTATGYDVIDIEAAKERNIVVTSVPTYATTSVSQMVFALLLELCHHVGYHSETVHQGKWTKCDNFCYWDRPLVELSGLTMGIVGFGRIGRSTARIAEAFGMRVIAYDVFKTDEESDVAAVNLETIFTDSDVISLHCPLTEQTLELVDKNRLSKMKRTAFLINTSRGHLVNEKDLADALNNGIIAGAGLDVLSIEPPREDNPLLTARNCYITPHIAWATKSARSRLMSVAIDNVKAFIRGNGRNVVT
jgi:glycerate dehydrogenase